ncbi:MAG: phasin family protein [Pseudomonadales bacterium]|jgi:phasin family protein|nr:phasin family protein [Pseudomonadales bacterium]
MSSERRMTRVLKPVNDLVVLNAEATGTILMRQNAFFGDLVSASVDQVKTLTSVGSVREAMDAQRTYLREIGSKFQSVARENVETLRDATRDASNVIRGAFRRAQDTVTEEVNELRTEAAEAIAPQAQQPAPTGFQPTTTY